jgi:hypothetical protein
MIDRINTIREALVLATDGPIVGRGELMQEALTALAVLEVAMKTPVAYVSVPDLKKLKKSKAADMYVRAFPPPAVGTSEIALYLAAPPAQQRNEWKEAVLDKLAEHCIDAPQDEPPASILSRIITMAVQMATDPAINTPAQQAQAEAVPSDVVRDAERWRMLSAYFYEYQIDAMKLYRDIDAAIAQQKGQP